MVAERNTRQTIIAMLLLAIMVVAMVVAVQETAEEWIAREVGKTALESFKALTGEVGSPNPNPCFELDDGEYAQLAELYQSLKDNRSWMASMAGASSQGMHYELYYYLSSRGYPNLPDISMNERTGRRQLEKYVNKTLKYGKAGDCP